MTDMSLGVPFAEKTWDLINGTGCIPTETVVKMFQSTVLMSDAVKVAVSLFFIGILYGFLLYHFFRSKDGTQ